MAKSALLLHGGARCSGRWLREMPLTRNACRRPRDPNSEGGTASGCVCRVYRAGLVLKEARCDGKAESSATRPAGASAVGVHQRLEYAV